VIRNHQNHRRRSIRLKEYDYSQGGWYFITICVYRKDIVLNNIINGEIHLNAFGKIVESTWYDLPNHNDHILLDYFTIMPNHVHGIIVIKENPLATAPVGAGSEPAPTRHGLHEIIRQFKTFSSMRINSKLNGPRSPFWQRNYFERIIRNENEINRIRKYITENPLKWAEDQYNPINKNKNFSTDLVSITK
jgi:putative transposase